MTVKSIRLNPQEGYDLWADVYDATPNPIVAMDARHTLRLLAPQKNELILDAGCGTGRNLPKLLEAGVRPIGFDFSAGMLRVARKKFRNTPLVCGDLQRRLPFRSETFDAVLNALIGEHLDNLETVFRETFRVLRPNGRFVFSVYHPALAAAGKEANFMLNGIEYRLGAVRHTIDDYLTMLEDVGFTDTLKHEFAGDDELARIVPAASKLINQHILLVLTSRKS